MKSQVLDLGTLGKTGQFSELLELLRATDYGDEFLCRRFNLERAEDFEINAKKRSPLPVCESRADVLTALFLAGEAVAFDTVRKFFDAGKIALFEGMGLLQHETECARCFATIALYPVGDLYIASDRWNTHDGSPFTVEEDIVFPAFIPNTRLFLRHLPEQPCGIYLDLCGGTGVAALLTAKRGSQQAWSGDISDRSTRFAEFNRQLNGIRGVQAVTSDLYQRFENCRFDVISAHPPYVPTLQPKWIFYSGGHDGEEITRRIVEGLPDHLNDGGIFIALTMGTDRRGRPFERRVREWLGAGGKDFDIAFLAHREDDPQEFALRVNRETIRSPEETELWRRLFKSLEITALAYGFVCIQRRSGAHRTFTVRRQASPAALRAPWEWLLSWESAFCGERLEPLILDSPLHASRQTEFLVLHHLAEGSWSPASYKLRAQYPFNMECNAQPWMAHLISLCDGKTTGRDALRTLIQNKALPESTPEGEFARATASLVSGGFIEVEGFRLPREVK
jgi:SAM-dependent methyltransferase